MDLSEHRFEYEAEPIDLASLAADPVDQFRTWFDTAVASADPEPHAMVLSTVDAAGRPRGRNVLLRAYDEDGFVFYTNVDSAKGRALAATGLAALTFHWAVLHRQVHVEGRASRVADHEADAYFATRPRGSQLGAWASAQSAPIDSRDDLLAAFAAAEARFADTDVPRPPHWGGWRVAPDAMEFWQGQPSRLHDRIRYDRTDAGWERVRLNP